MKLIVNKNDFQKIISLAERNSGKNPTLPVLSSILIKASNNHIVATSTNLEVGFEASLPAKVEKEGIAAVPSKSFLSLLSSIPDEDLRMESGGGGLKLLSKTSSTNLKCFDYNDFPLLPKIEKTGSFKISSSELLDSLKNTLISSSLSNLKPELSSVFISSKTKTPLTFAATDSFRLSEHRTNLLLSDPISVLLPYKSAQEILRILEDLNEMVEINFSKNQFVFKSKNISFLSRINEGGFPDYRGIIPKSFSTQVFVDKPQLVGAVKAASIFSGRLADVILRAEQNDSDLKVSSKESDTGEHCSLVAAKVSGDGFEVSFNYHYLLEALQVMPETHLFFGFNGPVKAALLRGQGQDSYFHLIMPMRSV